MKYTRNVQNRFRLYYTPRDPEIPCASFKMKSDMLRIIYLSQLFKKLSKS
jgi:hypothetical protein